MSGYDDTNTLLQANITLIVDKVCSSLRRSLQESRLPCPRLSRTLSMIFSRPENFTKEAFVLVRDAVLDALVVLDSLAAEGRLPDDSVIELLRALKTLVQCCGPAQDVPKINAINGYSMESTIAHSLTHFRTAVHSIYNSADPAVEVDAEHRVEQAPEESEDTEVNGFLPLLVVQILERCGYFLAQNSLGLGALNIVVETIGSGLTRIAANRKVLLPMVSSLQAIVFHRQLFNINIFRRCTSFGHRYLVG